MENNSKNEPMIQPSIISQQNLSPTFIPITSDNNVTQANSQNNLPQNFSQQNVINPEVFKSKLCCPRVLVWISFVAHLFFGFVLMLNFIDSSFIFGIISDIIMCIFQFLITFLVNQSVTTVDGKKYKLALYLYIGYIICIIIFFIILGYMSHIFYVLVIFIYALYIIVPESIILGILFYFKKEFNEMSTLNNPQSISTQ